MLLPTRSQTTFAGLPALICRFLAITIAIGVCATGGSHKGQAQEPSDDDDVLRVSTELLLFPIRIRERKKQTTTSLTERDLTLKDPDGITSGLYFYQGIDRVALVFAL